MKTVDDEASPVPSCMLPSVFPAKGSVPCGIAAKYVAGVAALLRWPDARLGRMETVNGKINETHTRYTCDETIHERAKSR